MIGWILLGGILLLGMRKWAPGSGPFDQMPEGVDTAHKLAVNDVKSKDSMRSYKVHSYARGTQFFAVAVRISGKDWISYLYEPSTNQKMMFRANAGSDAALQTMRKDFEL